MYNLKIERDLNLNNLVVGNLNVGSINGSPYNPVSGTVDRAVGLSNPILPTLVINIFPLFNSSSIIFTGNINLSGNNKYYIKCVIENVVFINHIGSATFQVFNNLNNPVSAQLIIIGSGQFNPSYGFQSINFLYTTNNDQLQLRLVNSSNLKSIERVYVDVSVV
jgi:hypothetical protein